MNLKTLLELYGNAGYYYHFYPRKKQVSLSGHRNISEQEAFNKLLELHKQGKI